MVNMCDCKNNTCGIQVPHFWVKNLPLSNEVCPNAIYFLNTFGVISMYVSSNDSELFLVGTGGSTGDIIISSPLNTITISGTEGQFFIDISETIQQAIDDALQPGDNVSLLNNDADYQIGSNLPDDIFISTTIDGKYITYEVDGIFKQLDLQQFTSIDIINTNEIVKNGNDLYLTGNFSETANGFILALYNCRIVNGVLVVSSADSAEVPTIATHNLVFHREFLYMTSRTLITTIIKINPYDLTDIRSLTMPDTADFNGYTTDLIGYKDKLYILCNTSNNYTGNLKFIEIDTDLIGFRLKFIVPPTVPYRGHLQNPFLIYNDEVYIPLYNISTRLSLKVFDMDGNLKRQNVYSTLNYTGTYGMTPHWMTIFNDKLIITTVYRKSLIRINAITLELEESIALTNSITDDNSVSNDGYIYLNGEVNPFDPLASTPTLSKVKYNNFTNYTVLISGYNNSKGSYGSINNTLYKDTLKTKLSEFTNDVGYTTLEDIPDQNNKVVILQIPIDELSGEGSEPEQIIEWLNNNGISVDDKTNLLIEVDEKETSTVKTFDVNLDNSYNACIDIINPNYNTILYFVGENSAPIVGDLVYEDEGMTQPFSGGDYNARVWDTYLNSITNGWIRAEEGVLTTINCK